MFALHVNHWNLWSHSKNEPSHVWGKGDAYNHIETRDAAVLSPDFDVDLQPRAPKFFHDGRNFEGQIDVIGDTVFHEDERPVRRDEGDGLVAIEFAQLYALVERHVLHLDPKLRSSAWRDHGT